MFPLTGRNICFLVAFILWIGSAARAQEDTCACCTDNHMAFDFWVGTWKVTDAEGSFVGRNRIDKVEDGCVLREHWTSSKENFSGTSLNFYNSKTRQWEQLWVNNFGNHLKLKGNRVGNQMILSSEDFVHTDGNTYQNRITWTLNDNGTVRQLWEVLQDDKVSNVVFDGLYSKEDE